MGRLALRKHQSVNAAHRQLARSKRQRAMRRESLRDASSSNEDIQTLYTVFRQRLMAKMPNLQSRLSRVDFILGEWPHLKAISHLSRNGEIASPAPLHSCPACGAQLASLPEQTAPPPCGCWGCSPAICHSLDCICPRVNYRNLDCECVI